MKDTSPFLKYWRKSLLDSSNGDPKLIRESLASEEKPLRLLTQKDNVGLEASEDVSKDIIEPVVIHDFQMNNPSLDVRVFESIKNMYESIKGPQKDDSKISILIAPIRIEKNNKRKSPFEALRYYYPLWIPVLCNSSGVLFPPKFSHPHISRRYLSPNDSTKGSLILGQTQVYDELCKNFKQSFESYEAYSKDIVSFFKEITHIDLGGKEVVAEIEVDNVHFTVSHDATVVVNDGISASHNIIRLYDFLINGQESSDLLNNLIYGAKDEEPITPVDKDEFSECESLLTGDMEGEKDISDSQRSALYTWFKFPKNKILTVPGPPGTGKTYLLQNLVATTVINSALRGTMPKVIIACCYSNQAVKNIINCMLACSESRWLPQPANTIGEKIADRLGGAAFLASKSAKDSEQEYVFYKDFAYGSIPNLYESEEYVTSAKTVFYEEFCNAYGDIGGLDKVPDKLKKELVSQIKLLEELAIEDNDLSSKYRRSIFQIAVRYWESRWLIQADEMIFKSIQSIDDFQHFWEWRSMLTPCLAGTFHTIPDVFLFKRKEEGVGLILDYLNEFADTLIIDEAGQVSPEIGVPILTFAKRAIVLGDIEQIQPIWEIPADIDKSNLESTGILTDNDFTEIETQGYLSSSGSLMKLAQNACMVLSPLGVRGVPLREHHRCYSEIIGFSNELCYNNIIEPQRTPDCNSPFFGTPDCEEPFPPMQIIRVQGESISKEGTGSRFNLNECLAIRKWIEDNESSIVGMRIKNGDEETIITCVQDAIAILTPYNAQRQLIKAWLRGEELNKNKKGNGADISKVGLKNYLTFQDDGGKKHEITVGTVHAMQGAQRPIILFSCVLTPLDSLDFIDRHMLNVAVSRAQNSFIAFMHPDLLDNSEEDQHPIRRFVNYYHRLVSNHPEFDTKYTAEHPEDFKWQTRIFISYRHSERALSEIIFNGLQDKGYSPKAIFWDEDSLVGGDIFRDKIQKSISQCKFFILVYNQDSIKRCHEENDVVAEEILLAIKTGCRIIPVNVDNCTPDWTWIEDESLREKINDKLTWIPVSSADLQREECRNNLNSAIFSAIMSR